MKEYKNAIIYLLNKIKQAETGEDAVLYTQSFQNLIGVSKSSSDLLKELMKDES